MASALTVALALLPLFVVFVGIIVFRISGAKMALIGWGLAALEVGTYFQTSWDIVFGATIYGILKAFGITIAVIFTMLMIFTMKEVGALSIISDAIKRVAKTKEQQALFIGIGFGTFVTSLGVVTPALFPPLLMAMGFGPAASVAIAVIGYNASTSFALLSIPVTLPAHLYGFDAFVFAFKITIFLPVISTLISLAMLWVIGGKESLKKGWVPAVLSGLVIGFTALALVLIRAPIMIVGVIAGLVTMGVLYGYQKFENRELEKEKPIVWKPLLKAMSPWLILIALASVVSIPPVTRFFESLDGSGINLGWVTAYQTVDFDVFSSVYFWILVAFLLSLPILKPSREQMNRVTKVWIRRIWPPFIAYSLFFSLSFLMAFSAMVVVNGPTGPHLAPGKYYNDLNMNVAIGAALASIGAAYVFLSPLLGIFGAVVGGSETGSNVMFYKIQEQASTDIGLNNAQFMTIYGAHANAGGIASAITPSKINNAVATIGGGGSLEAAIMKKNTVIVLGITFVLSIMTWIFVQMGI